MRRPRSTGEATVAETPPVPTDALRAAEEALAEVIERCSAAGVAPDRSYLASVVVAAAWPFGVAAGRTQLAADLGATFDRIAASERESLVSTPPEYVEDQVRYRARAVAFKRSAGIVRQTARESPRLGDTPDA
jgi:hypothetical protein